MSKVLSICLSLSLLLGSCFTTPVLNNASPSAATLSSPPPIAKTALTSPKITPLSSASKKVCRTPEELYDALQLVVVYIVTTNSKNERFSGSGTVIDSKGTIVTSAHVIRGATRIEVVDYKRTHYLYELKTQGTEYSISSIKPITSYPENFILPAVPELVMGESLYSLGFPYSYYFYSSGHLSGGINKGEYNWLLTSMPSSPGQSGASVVDCEGKIVGFIWGGDSRSDTLTFFNSYEELESVK